jgi:hypothetical protein
MCGSCKLIFAHTLPHQLIAVFTLSCVVQGWSNMCIYINTNGGRRYSHWNGGCGGSPNCPAPSTTTGISNNYHSTSYYQSVTGGNAYEWISNECTSIYGGIYVTPCELRSCTRLIGSAAGCSGA